VGVLGLALLAGCGARTAAGGPGIDTAPSSTAANPHRPGPLGTTSAVPEAQCSPGGVAVSAVGGDAAMGLRVLTIELVNCGAAPLTVNGYPDLRLYDEDDELVEAAVLHGSADISLLPEFDNPPVAITLRPGEKARSGLLWRNLVTDPTVDATTATRLEAAPTPGAPWVAVPLVVPNEVTGSSTVTIDLGNTGRLGVQAWQRAW
jgi:uncharacterized protein DUF4232